MTEDRDFRRSFEDSKSNKYYISAPTAEDVRGADWQYSKTYTNSLVEGITTSAEMTDILMRRGIIGPEFEQRSNELTENLNNKIIQLNNATDVNEKRDLSIDVAIAREELFQWNQRLNGPMGNTCEQIADDARLEYLTSCIVQKEDGSKVWSSYNDYLKEKNQDIAMKARFEVMLYLQGLDSDFLDNTPEAKAMREVEEDILDKAREAIALAQANLDKEDEKVSVDTQDKKQKKTKKTPSKK